jgi:menaquinone-specific isochorismate synthase
LSLDASRQLELTEIESLLGNGWFMGIGPEKVMVAWGAPKKNKKPIHDRPQFYIPDFYLADKSPWVSFENVLVTDRTSMIQKLRHLANHPRLELRWQPPNIEDFRRAFDLVKNEIKSQKLRKAVPVVFSRAQSSVTKAMRAHFIANLLTNATKPTPYGYMAPTEGLIGASPEILFSYDAGQGVLETMALAGTRQNEREEQESLEHDPKEMFEHELVIQGLKEKLNGFGDLHVSPTYVWNIGTLSHLRTDISVDLKNQPNPMTIFTEMCALLHPTAALGVSPMSADWHFLKQCDDQIDRRRFGAPFGVLNPDGRSTALVAIRGLQWEEDRITMGTGCGVVAASELQNEWQELELKRSSICKLLGL